MKKLIWICQNLRSLVPTFIFTNLFFLLLLFGINPVNAQGNSKAGQWAEVGGEKILSGNHNFTTSWASNANSRQEGKWWPSGFWDPTDTRQYTPWENAVLNSVAPKKGQITVQGPGNVGLYQKGKGARIHMTDNKTKAGFTPWINTIGWQYDKWVGTVKDYNINGEFWGFVPAGTEITLDITAIMSSYNNQGGTGEVSYNAPQDVEYEIWFFPREGGKVISVTSTSGSGKPMPGDLYYTDKECK